MIQLLRRKFRGLFNGVNDLVRINDLDLMVRQEAYILELFRQPRYQEPKRLFRHENQVFSRHGQDGVIDEIFRRIGTTDRVFVEIGCGNGMENNTANLLWANWSGFWFDGNEFDIATATSRCASLIREGRLHASQAFFSAENVEAVMSHAGVPNEFDLFSLDIDRNTYYVWEAIKNFRPRVVVVEYNSKVLPWVDWKVHYDPAKQWDGTNYMGASLKALENLGRSMGYNLVGCELVGADAFFVRADLTADHFAEPFTSENHYEPPRYFLTRNQGHPNNISD